MITKVLIKLLEAPVKPEHPMDFIRDNLGATMYERNQIDQLEQQVNDYKKEVIDLKNQIDDLKSKLKETDKSEEKLTSGNVVDSAIVEKITETAVSASPTPTLTGGAKIDDPADIKISESEKAVAPASVDVCEVPVIEAATAVDQSKVPKVFDNGETPNVVESAPTSGNVNADTDLQSTRKKAINGHNSNVVAVPVTENGEAIADATEKDDTNKDTKPTVAASVEDTQN